MITLDELRTKLTGYPEALFADYQAFLATREPAALHRFVVGLIRFLHDSDQQTAGADPADTANLRADLGIDSITIAEVVFLIEDIFGVEIANDEIAAIETVGELKAFLSRKVA